MLAALGNGVQRDESLFRGARIVHHDCNLWTGEPIPMGNHRLESRVRENRTHGSEGGDGDSRSRPLSPWEEAAVEEAGFWGRHFPGFRSLPQRDFASKPIRGANS
jgi:hypothetical protein